MPGSNCMVEGEGKVRWKFDTKVIVSVEGFSVMVLVAGATSRK